MDQLISVSEYLRTSYRPDCDYVDGEVRERNVGEQDHSWLMGEMVNVLFPLSESHKLYPFLTVRIRVSPTRVRVPDVTVTRGIPNEQVFTHPPFLCIEILSPEDSMTSMQERIDDYVTFGVENIWILDPIRKKAFWADANGTYPSRTGVLHTKDSQLSVDLAPLWFS